MEIDLKKYAAIIFGKGSLVIALLFLLIISCDPLKNPFLQDLPTDSLQNQAPETHLFLNFPADSVLPDTTTSRQVLYWWGEDPDGEVVAYHVRWSFEDTWSRTVAEDSTFFLPLRTIYKEFVFEIVAEDNEGLLDPSPATLTIPVANSTPEIEFANNSNPSAGSNPNVTHVTFPTRTFAWSVSDLDGLETINRIRYRVDSTSVWNYVEGDISTITLDNIDPGFHTFYVQAIDTAGSTSNLLQFPDSTDSASPNKWLVKEPVGDILLIDDYENDDGSTHAFYTDILDSLVGIDNYSIFEIGSDEKSLPSSSTDQVAMYSYFKTVIWYHYSLAPSLPNADGPLRTYLESGGNAFISSIFIDTDYTFTSIDTNWVINPSGRLLPDLEINLIDIQVTDSTKILPDLTLKTSALIARRVSAYFPADLFDGETSRDLFILSEARADKLETWTGTPPVAQLFQPSAGSGQSIFFSLPLHFCVGNNNAVQVMNHLLFEVFQ
jgi:hypothetical protein